MEMKEKSYLFLVITLIVIGSLLVVAVILLILNNGSNANKKCSEGYSYLNNKCVKLETTNAIATKYCFEGFELVGNNCKKVETEAPSRSYACSNVDGNGKVNVSAPKLNGSVCEYIFSHDAVEQKTCPKGCFFTTKDECQCTIDLPPAIMGTGEHTRVVCAEGYFTGSVCRIVTNPKPTISKVCVEGFSLVNGVCQKKYYYDAVVSLSCIGDFKLNGNICERTKIESSKIRYECPQGYTLVGSSCQREIVMDIIE